MKTQDAEIRDVAKAVLREIYSYKHIIREEISQLNNLILHLKELGKSKLRTIKGRK